MGKACTALIATLMLTGCAGSGGLALMEQTDPPKPAATLAPPADAQDCPLRSPHRKLEYASLVKGDLALPPPGTAQSNSAIGCPNSSTRTVVYAGLIWDARSSTEIRGRDLS